MRALTQRVLLAVVGGGALAGCAEPAGGGRSCGPARGVVARVIDGDTIELESGERIRYLLVDTPESTAEVECWGPEASAANEELVLGRTVQLAYDVECTDRYDRLLAYVTLGERLINQVLVERGHACVLHIPPNGEERLEELEAAEDFARESARGLWAACADRPC